ncbi:hypothetical protein RRF57_013129 [Xylaria bambusicola]|uniref:Uncharacterized protein n=1 Tax=Xylaria bambusicola TaxID=326684 RepID=A0AAN7ZFC2_9PEZI
MRQGPRPNDLSSTSADARGASILGVAACIASPLRHVPAPTDSTSDTLDTIAGADSPRRFFLCLLPFTLALTFELHLTFQEGLTRPPAGFGLVLRLGTSFVFGVAFCCGV